jgi:hypothetical protein
VVLYVDRDDEPSHALDHADLSVIQLIRPRAKMGVMTQVCYAASSGRYLMLLNDDVVFRTGGWDTAVLEAFARHGDDVAVVWGNDLFRGSLFPTHPFLSRTACDVLGGVCPGKYHRDYIDTHIYDIFCNLSQLGHHRLVYLPDVVFEHLHVEAGKAAPDDTSVKDRQTDDELTYIAWAEERRLAAVRLARHITSRDRHGLPVGRISRFRTGQESPSPGG